MFWRFGGYSSASTIDTLLDKPDTTLEELLDESDLIQELKQHNSKLIEFMRNENNLHRLLKYVVAPKIEDPEDDESEDGIDRSRESSRGDGVQETETKMAKKEKRKGKSVRRDFSEDDQEREEKARLKYAYVACEVLSVDIYSIQESILSATESFHQFWQFLKRDPPLDPLQAGYFTKVNESLLDKKTEETLDILKAQEDVVQDMLRNVDCPMIMDLLLKIISLGKADEGQSVVDWLHAQNLIPILLSHLSMEHSSSTQTSAGDFLKAVITISANASQNEQSCIGPNDLTRQLVSDQCIRRLITDMLRGGNPLTVGVGIIIEVIRKNNSDYDPEVGAGADATPTSRDPIYLGTLLRLFAQHVPDYMNLILSSTYSVINEDGSTTVKVRELKSASGETIEPLGFDRFKTCELMAELLHCSNMGLLNERGSEKFVKERDGERDRLKQEGGLMTSRDSQSRSEFNHDGSGYYHDQSPSAIGSGSPEEIRKLEVANGGEDDGFEDVAVSEALNDEVKDDFDERGEMELEARQFEERNIEDAEFVDEPLSSPRLRVPHEKAIEDDITSLSTSPSGQLPSSPNSSDLTEKVSGLELSQDKNTSTSAATSISPDSNQNQLDPKAQSPSIPSKTQLTGSPPRPEGEQSGEARDLKASIEKGPSGLSPIPEVLSPHSNDQPPPLFADRPDQSSKADDDETADLDHAQADTSQETIDTTLGEEGDSVRSVLMSGNDTTFEPHIELDIDGSPVVGDYLKMMFVEHRVVPTILDFFFRFPWNNFLHNVVYDVVQQVFNGPMDRGYNRSLAIDLFETGRITERIVEGQRRSDKAQAETNMRLGYMGHLTLIAEEVVKFTERHPPEFLSKSVLDKVMHADWIDYVERTLAETRERDNAILGGVRPDMSVGPRQAVINSLNAAQGYGNGPSAALANAGLTSGSGPLDSLDLGNGVNSSGGSFGLGGGSLLSGFGSSSDDEDEEMEDENEDESMRNANASNSDQFSHFAATAGSEPEDLEPSSDTNTHLPNIPPPPPPLNIGPSRARRQLQSRLAAKARQEEEDRSRTGEKAHGNGYGDESTSAEDGSMEFGFGYDDVWADHGGEQDEAQPHGLPSPTASSPSGSSSDGDDDAVLTIPPYNKGASGSRRPSTTEATTRSALETETDDEDDSLDDDDDEEGDVVDLGNGGAAKEDVSLPIEISSPKAKENQKAHA
ncbi:MAG: hypothetical protein M1837_004259 [Sclerophora amabilis]|nr:MAG: hypothetical protein M1837_004259 [Sclerophora amabilis]